MNKEKTDLLKDITKEEPGEKKKYTDTKKQGSPIETPYKHGDVRNKTKTS